MSKKRGVSFTKKDKDPTGGLTPEGRRKYKRETGGNLEPPVTKKTGLSPRQKARRKSFCARMSKAKGPLKDKDGKLTRKALALRKWNCGSVKT
jgi:hypothetical protein